MGRICLLSIIVFCLLSTATMASQTQTKLDNAGNLLFEVVDPNAPPGDPPTRFKMGHDGSLTLPQVKEEADYPKCARKGLIRWNIQRNSFENCIEVANGKEWRPVGSGNVLASYYQGVPEGWTSQIIDLPQEGVLNAHCFAAAKIYVEGTCPYDQWNTGVEAIIQVDGAVCSQDTSFNFPSCRVNFRSTAACARPLAAGQHTISCYVGRYGDDMASETFESSSFGFNVIAK